MLAQNVLVGFGHSQLGGEGTLAHAGGVSLHNADRQGQLATGNAGTDGCIGRDGVGGGGVGVDTKVDITQRTQLSLEHNLLAGIVCLGKELPYVADIRGKQLGVALAPCPHFVHADGLLTVDVDHGQVLGLDDGFQTLADACVHMDKVAHTQGLFHKLIAVAVGDAALGGAELGAGLGQTLLLQTVLCNMERHGDGGAVGNFQVLGADLDALLGQSGNLFFKMLGVDDHTAAHNADDVRAQNAGGDQIQHEFAAFVLDGVTGVVAALITGNNVIILAEQVDHTTLALVAPVDTGDCSKHTFLPLS